MLGISSLYHTRSEKSRGKTVDNGLICGRAGEPSLDRPVSGPDVDEPMSGYATYRELARSCRGRSLVGRGCINIDPADVSASVSNTVSDCLNLVSICQGCAGSSGTRGRLPSDVSAAGCGGQKRKRSHASATHNTTLKTLLIIGYSLYPDWRITL